MQGLGRLTGMDADRLAGGQQVARQEEAVEQGQKPGVLGHPLEDGPSGDQGVDPFGGVAFEGVPAAVLVRQGVDPLTGLGQVGGRQEVLDEGEAIPGQPSGVPVDVKSGVFHPVRPPRLLRPSCAFS